MIHRYYCVIDADGYYKTLVDAEVSIDIETGEETINVQWYELNDGESLVLRTDECPQPTLQIYAGSGGFVLPRWDGSAWVEGAIPEEVAAWEEEHPAPLPPEPSPVEILQEENKLLKAQLIATGDRQAFMEDCIAEMAIQVYNV